MSKKRNRYSREFKREAIRKLSLGEKSGADLARELGIQRNMLYKWRREYSAKGDAAFRGPGRRSNSERREEILKRENQRLKKENEILKKAAAFFARELK